MSKASIPVDEDTKRLLQELKPADESWDAFLRRTTLAEEPIEKGFLSEDGSDAVREEIRNSRESS